MNAAQSVFRQLQYSLIGHPIKWSTQNLVIIILSGLLLASCIGLIKVSLRYDSTDSERWWWYYFTEQLISWGQWLVWIPLLLAFVQFIVQKIENQIKIYALLGITLIFLGFTAASLEGLLWHSLLNTSSKWPWTRVWKAFVSTQFGFHFFIGTIAILFLVVRQLIVSYKKMNRQSLPKIKLVQDPIVGSLVIKHRDRTEFIQLQDILHLQASGSYVEIYSIHGKTIATGTLKEFMSQLPYPQFIRIHRSYLVRVDSVKSLTPLTNEDYKVTTTGGHELRLSRKYKQHLNILKGLVA